MPLSWLRKDYDWVSPHVCGRAEASRVRTPFSTKYCHQGGEDDVDNGDGDGDGDDENDVEITDCGDEK